MKTNEDDSSSKMPEMTLMTQLDRKKTKITVTQVHQKKGQEYKNIGDSSSILQN